MSLIPWTRRLAELDRWRPALAWSRSWPLIVRGMREHDPAWIDRFFWRYRFWTWVLSVGDEPTTCRSCGSRIESAHALSTYCSVACRKVAYRRRQAGKPTELEALLVEARAELREVERTLENAGRWLRRKQGGIFLTVPPDLTQLPNLPSKPSRCAEDTCSQGTACRHTGGICLYASTGVWTSEDDL